eukprot:CAMPEP_0197025630 /NCGR_PEP_ID=MMETSP1384-20130603/5894_1 /TAXON_ID=29189 /ORGANISM="Ammonia sp." /LENGTH=299 /DNA_ID=CAMNT_0042454179 /DNA_START=43 /DNA_END=942 /DNA_ORIENTATION=-
MTVMCALVLLLVVCFHANAKCKDGHEWTHVFDLLELADSGDVVFTLSETPDHWPDHENGGKFFQGTAGEDYGFASAKIFVNDDKDTACMSFRGFGFPPDWPITVWFVLAPEPGAAHPIFADGYAGPESPVAATTAAFNSGRDSFNEQSVVQVNRRGKMKFDMDLDYNPLRSLQVPLCNELQQVFQTQFPSESISDGIISYDNLRQPLFRSSGKYSTIGREFIRMFNQTDGLQILDEIGRAKVVRAPYPAPLIAIVSHPDGITHGTHSSIFCPEMEEEGNWGCGDHFELAVFELAGIFMD